MIFPGVRLFPAVGPGEPLFGFTVLSPFAECIVDGPKRIENRDKVPPVRLHRGAFWCAIHTGARLYPGVTREDFRRPFRRPDGERAALWPECPPFAALNPRHVLGAARVIGFDLGRTDARVDADPWAIEGSIRWLLDPTVIRLPTPFPWPRGELGLWAPKASDPNPARAEMGAAFLRLRDALRAAMADPTCHRRAVSAWHPGAM